MLEDYIRLRAINECNEDVGAPTTPSNTKETSNQHEPLNSRTSASPVIKLAQPSRQMADKLFP